MLKTPDDVRAEFDHRGISIAEWARAHGFSQALVYQVLQPDSNPRRGQSHKIAVLLGLKNGSIEQDVNVINHIQSPGA